VVSGFLRTISERPLPAQAGGGPGIRGCKRAACPHASCVQPALGHERQTAHHRLRSDDRLSCLASSGARPCDEEGGGDACNGTQDADIGNRLARFGWKGGMISPATLEEAPTCPRSWKVQRTVWIKAHMQTCVILARHPLGAAPCTAPDRSKPVHIPEHRGVALDHARPWLSRHDRCRVCLTLATHATLRMIATMPFDWPLQSLATIAALFERHFKPHLLLKTQRGVRGSQPALPESGCLLGGSRAGNGEQLYVPFMSEAR
jgi:hypothetical protein